MNSYTTFIFTTTMWVCGWLFQALVFQQRAVFMSERVLGIDHPNTITEYVCTEKSDCADK